MLRSIGYIERFCDCLIRRKVAQYERLVSKTTGLRPALQFELCNLRHIGFSSLEMSTEEKRGEISAIALSLAWQVDLVTAEDCLQQTNEGNL